MKFYFLFIIVMFSSFLKSQELEDFLMTNEELPKKYYISHKDFTKSFHPVYVYDRYDFVKEDVPRIKKRALQSLVGKYDNGTVFYIEFFERNVDTNWIKGFLYSPIINEPSEEHPEEYLMHKNFLIIWSFDQESPIKKLSINKVKSLLE